MIQEIETAIVERLVQALPKLRVEPFPDDPDKYTLRHAHGAVLVGYRGGVYGAEEAGGPVVQPRRMEFDMTVLTRNLRDHGGAYGHVDAVRIALTGFRPAGWRKMVAVRERFLALRDGVWRYAITMATSGVVMEIAETDQPALLQRVTFEENAP